MQQQEVQIPRLVDQKPHCNAFINWFLAVEMSEPTEHNLTLYCSRSRGPENASYQMIKSTFKRNEFFSFALLDIVSDRLAADWHAGCINAARRGRHWVVDRGAGPRSTRKSQPTIPSFGSQSDWYFSPDQQLPGLPTTVRPSQCLWCYNNI